MNIRSFEDHVPQISKAVFIDPTALVIGQVTIGENSSVWPMTVIRGDVHSIKIGARTSIQDGSVLHVTHAGPYQPDGFALNIGDDVTIGHKALLHGCTIGNRCLIGMGAVVMDGAVINDEVILGANSLVPPGRTLESGFLWMGTPAKKIRKLSEKEIAFFKYSADNYVKLKNRYLEN